MYRSGTGIETKLSVLVLLSKNCDWYPGLHTAHIKLAEKHVHVQLPLLYADISL